METFFLIGCCKQRGCCPCTYSGACVIDSLPRGIFVEQLETLQFIAALASESSELHRCDSGKDLPGTCRYKYEDRGAANILQRRQQEMLKSVVFALVVILAVASAYPSLVATGLLGAPVVAQIGITAPIGIGRIW